ncbi:hypothetical protein CDD83_7626 [Cordyceps sp. RAO-2017]|nr:hypothetical protein CDD83_7626 [Cordyceps sp. RAO-2017]
MHALVVLSILSSLVHARTVTPDGFTDVGRSNAMDLQPRAANLLRWVPEPWDMSIEGDCATKTSETADETYSKFCGTAIYCGLFDHGGYFSKEAKRMYRNKKHCLAAYARLPWIPEPEDMSVNGDCVTKTSGRVDETFDRYCGTASYCSMFDDDNFRFRRGVKRMYSSKQSCLDAHMRLPWIPEPGAMCNGDCVTKTSGRVNETFDQYCGTASYCSMFDHDNDSNSGVKQLYKSKEACLEDHEMAPLSGA